MKEVVIPGEHEGDLTPRRKWGDWAYAFPDERLKLMGIMKEMLLKNMTKPFLLAELERLGVREKEHKSMMEFLYE